MSAHAVLGGSIHEDPMQTDKNLPDALLGERVINTQQAAGLLNVSVATVRRQCARGDIPRPIKLSERRIGWRVKDLLAHIQTRGGQK